MRTGKPQVLFEDAPQLDLPVTDEMEKFSMERLGSDNYECWSFQLKSLLMREELWKYVITDAPEPVTETWTNGDAKTQGTISLFVENHAAVTDP